MPVMGHLHYIAFKVFAVERFKFCGAQSGCIARNEYFCVLRFDSDNTGAVIEICYSQRVNILVGEKNIYFKIADIKPLPCMEFNLFCGMIFKCVKQFFCKEFFLPVPAVIRIILRQ